MLKWILIPVFVLAAEQKAHVHGSAQVSIAFDGKKGKIEMEIPGHTLFGFEHEARSKKDKAAKDQALAKLDEKMAEMIVFDIANECVVKREAFEVNQASNHMDVDAEFSVVCQKPVKETNITFHFQKYFSRLKKVKVDVIVDDVQKSVEVTKNGDVLELK